MRARPILFVGNKRSGTTLLTYVLNQHNKIYVGNELDVVWHLVHNVEDDQNVHGCKAYYFRDKIGELPDDPREAFFHVCIKFKDTLVPGFTEDYSNKDTSVLRFVGDKSPIRHLHSSSKAFIDKHLADAVLIHIVRDPSTAIVSMVSTCFKPSDPIWESECIFGKPETKNIESAANVWVAIEQRTLELYGDKCLHIRYEDLCDSKEKEICRVYEELGIDPSYVVPMKRGGVRGTRYAEGYRWGFCKVPDVPGLAELRKLYGYSK